MTDKVLIVDDDETLLKVYEKALHGHYNVVTVSSGEEALVRADEQGPFAVVISDMQMPGMDGVTLLQKLKKKAPDTVRMMLTGLSDQKVALEAVNKGEIFRFLSKPPKREPLFGALDAALDQHRLITAERELLENTFKGSVEALTNVLSMTSPQIFGRAMRVKELVRECAKVLAIDDSWELETCAMLSQLGCVTLPDELINKVFGKEALTEQEQITYRKHPEASAELISSIPRMEAVAEAIRYQMKGFDGSGYPEDDLKGEQIPLGARLLKALLDVDERESDGMSGNEALADMRSHSPVYDPAILDALATVVDQQVSQEVKEMHVSALTTDMTIAENVYSKTGMLLVRDGQVVSTAIAEKLTNFMHNGSIDGIVKVHTSGDGEAEQADRH